MTSHPPLAAPQVDLSNWEIHSLMVGDTAVLRLRGVVDRHTSPAVRAEVQCMLREGARNLVFDCSQTPFMDSSGVQILVESQADAHLRSGTVTVLRPTDAVRLVLDSAGVSALLILDRP